MKKIVIVCAAVALLSVSLCGCGHNRCWNRGDSCSSCGPAMVETSSCGGCGDEASPYYEGVPMYEGSTIVSPTISPGIPAPGPVVN